MKAEVLAIGSEITSGLNIDTNSPWLARHLAEAGFACHFHTSIADEFSANIEAFSRALERVDVVVATGGLGPTADDLTREVVAQVLGVPLILNLEAEAHLVSLFTQRGREMPARNRVQAYFPAGATVIPNEHGTAPGIWAELHGKVIICLPGVPSEMKPMFLDWVLPRLAERAPSATTIVHRTLRCFGAGESHIETLLGDMIRRDRDPQVGITASEATISLRVTTSASSQGEALARIEPDLAFIRSKLGRLVFGMDDDTLQTVVARGLIEQKVTLSTVESCTGGLVGHLLTEVPGISAVYQAGLITYANEAKQELVDVPADLLRQHGAVSREVATAMATGCRERFGTELAVAITGVAGPGGGSAEKPVGLVHLALATPHDVRHAVYDWPGDRSSVKIRSAKAALNLIRLYLLDRASRG